MGCAVTRREERLLLALAAFAAYHAWRAHEAAQQAAILAATQGDFDPTSWQDWKSAVRDVAVSKVIEGTGKFLIRKVIP